jgi:alpha-1,3-glucosyltransferase
VFEDKVANFWCFTNLFIKWKRLSWAPQPVLIRISTALTALGFLPTVSVLLRTAFKIRLTSDSTPQDPPASQSQTSSSSSLLTSLFSPSSSVQPTPLLSLLPYTMLTSSIAFFMFSFQVHEKSILLPLLPITLLLSGSAIDSTTFGWGVLMNNVAVFSMWPLLKKDGLGLQYIALLMIWNRMIGYNPFRLPSGSVVQLISVVGHSVVVGILCSSCLYRPSTWQQCPSTSSNGSSHHLQGTPISSPS